MKVSGAYECPSFFNSNNILFTEPTSELETEPTKGIETEPEPTKSVKLEPVDPIEPTEPMGPMDDSSGKYSVKSFAAK